MVINKSIILYEDGIQDLYLQEDIHVIGKIFIYEAFTNNDNNQLIMIIHENSSYISILQNLCINKTPFKIKDFPELRDEFKDTEFICDSVQYGDQEQVLLCLAPKLLH